MITVQLDDNLRMEGYPKGTPLSWSTRLKAGANKLTLPILFLDSEEGQVTVELEYQNVRKSLEIPVKLSEDTLVPAATSEGGA